MEQSTVTSTVSIKKQTKTEIMDKFTEIKVLRSLKGDTYFNQFFSSEDIDQMCKNIEDDFAIEKDTMFNRKAQVCETKLRDAKEDHESQMRQFAETIVKDGRASSETFGVLAKKFGKMFVIKMKWKYEISLEDEEIEYMINKLSEK